MALVIGLLGVLILTALAALAIWVVLAAQREGQATEGPPLIGTWEPLDPVTPDEAAADMAQLRSLDLSRLAAWNVALSSGRSWRYVFRTEDEIDALAVLEITDRVIIEQRLKRMAEGAFG